VGPSLKELAKVTTPKTLCQVLPLGSGVVPGSPLHQCFSRLKLASVLRKPQDARLESLASPRLRVMATRSATDWLLLCASPPVVPPPLLPGGRADPPLAPSSAPDAMSPRSSPQARSPHPSAAPACQRAAPRSPGQPRHGRCGSCRFTRPIWPPVPRSGVAPLRSPQSLPYVRPPVKGPGTVSLRYIPS
jgi:hypothetical protein